MISVHVLISKYGVLVDSNRSAAKGSGTPQTTPQSKFIEDDWEE